MHRLIVVLWQFSLFSQEAAAQSFRWKMMEAKWHLFWTYRKWDSYQQYGMADNVCKCSDSREVWLALPSGGKEVLEEVNDLLNCLSLPSVTKDRVAETHYFVQMLAQIYLPTHISPGGHLQIYYMKQKNMDSTLPW